MIDPLLAAATVPRLRALAESGQLSPERWQEAVHHGEAPATDPMWRSALDRILLFLGSGLFLSGVMFFFAYNWQDLPMVAKLTLIHGAMAAAAGLSLQRGFDTPAGKVSLLAASVLFGIGQAVIGQSYQTGADPWTLFALYCGVTLPWALLARFPAMWLLWLCALVTAVGTAWTQLLGKDADLDLALVMAVIPGIAWALSTRPLPRAWGLGGSWLPRVLAVATTGILLIPTLANVFELSTQGMVGSAVLGAMAGATVVWGTQGKGDVFNAALLAAALVVWATTALSRIVFETLEFEVFGALFIGGTVVAEVGVAAAFLRWMVREKEAP